MPCGLPREKDRVLVQEQAPRPSCPGSSTFAAGARLRERMRLRGFARWQSDALWLVHGFKASRAATKPVVTLVHAPSGAFRT